jgi:hypothetical protein
VLCQAVFGWFVGSVICAQRIGFQSKTKKISDNRIAKIALAWANVERRQRKRVLA